LVFEKDNPMIPLFVLRLSFAFWKWTFALSKRFSGHTWVGLALLNASIAVFALSLYRAQDVSESAIPPVYYTQKALPDSSSASLVWAERRTTHLVVIDQSGSSYSAYSGGTEPFGLRLMYGETARENCPAYAHIWIWSRTANNSDGWVEHISENVIADWVWSTHRDFAMTNHMDHTRMDWQVPRWPPGMDRVILQTASDAPSLLTPVQQLAAILVGIVTTMLAILNTFLAWQVYRRSKAQEILLKLQIAKLERELAEMKAQDEKARKEGEKSNLVLLS
jgi:hypothetical protein